MAELWLSLAILAGFFFLQMRDSEFKSESAVACLIYTSGEQRSGRVLSGASLRSTICSLALTDSMILTQFPLQLNWNAQPGSNLSGT